MLNPEQKEAVETTSGRVLVLAGAGSGKTSVLACRIAHLIQNENVPPSSILGLTFTNKAAKEMQERVAKFVSPKIAKQVTLCTFHSFCMQLLRKEIHRLGFTSSFSLYDEKDVKRVLTQIVRHTLEHEGDLPSLQATMQKITQSRNLGLAEIEEEENGEESWYGSFSKDLLGRLQTCMRSYNAVDFDGLLTLTVQLLEEHPEALEKIQNKYKYVMIDEYQDTNPVQYKIANLLAGAHNNLCVVGDDDQSIYGWRGAEIKNILEFPYDKLVKLEQNYRSTPNILQAANQLIANNSERHKKELWSSQTESEPILLFHAPSDTEEAQSVVQRIVWYRKNKNLRWKDMAILYRSNALSKAFETSLIQAAWEEDGVWKRGIPYEVFGGTEFYERAEIKDLLAYLRVIENPMDEEALLRVINVPRRGISEKCLDKLTAYNRSHGLSLWEVLVATTDPFFSLIDDLSPKALSGIAKFISVIEKGKEKFKTDSLHKTFSDFIEEIEYKKAIREEVKSEKMREFKWDNVMSCVEALSSYEENKKTEDPEAIPTLQDFLSCTLLRSDRGPKKNDRQFEDKVHLMTIHSAKGLEFEACFLVCLEDRIMPHEKSVSEKELEEERRLMYVAMTRAKRHLILSMARERKRMGQKTATNPSRFLFEIPKDLLKIVSYQTIDIS